MNTPTNRLEIVYRRIDDLKPDPKNPRQHSTKQIRQLARSIETGEIDLKIAGIEGEPAAEAPADAEVEPSTTLKVSRPGDLWLLGDHRALCGSVLDTAALPALMGDERAAMVFTDPPYNVPID